MALKLTSPPSIFSQSRRFSSSLMPIRSKSTSRASSFAGFRSKTGVYLSKTALQSSSKVSVAAESTPVTISAEDWGKVSAVLFDMDGVLCNSEDLSRRAAVDVFKEMGVDVTVDDFVPFMGTGEAKFLGGVASAKGVEGYDPDAAKKRFFEIYLDKYAKPESGIGFPGAIELVTECKNKGLKVAVASSADRIKVDANLKAAGLSLTMFDAIVSADAFENLKPAPDIFLAAAKILGVRDALAGVQAAQAANMRCIAVKTTLSEAILKDAGPSMIRDDMLRSPQPQVPAATKRTGPLVSLKLSDLGLEDPGFVSMPCLKFLFLRKIRWSDTMTLEKLVSGCPVLEELILIREFYEDESVVTRVRSRSLKTFYLPLTYGTICYTRVPHTVLEIDAPGLEYLTLKEDHYDRIVAKNLTSLFMIDLDIKFVVKHGMSFDPEDLSKRNEICDFLTGISSARHMIISQQTIEAIYLYSKVGSIPKFKNLSHLQAMFPSPLLEFLPDFLESFPNLKHLILKIAFAKNDEMEELKLVNVPRCLVSTLECVEIKGLFEWKDEEKIIASYFLENSAVLKKLTLSFNDYPRFASSSDIYEDLDKVTKCSRSCRIIVDDD